MNYSENLIIDNNSNSSEIVILGEVKAFYDFWGAFYQIRLRLLFLRKIIKDSRPIIAMIVLKSPRKYLNEFQLFIIDQVENFYNCKILCMFVENEFLSESLHDEKSNSVKSTKSNKLENYQGIILICFKVKKLLSFYF